MDHENPSSESYQQSDDGSNYSDNDDDRASPILEGSSDIEMDDVDVRTRAMLDPKLHYKFCSKCGPDYTYRPSKRDADLEADPGPLWPCNTCTASMHENCITKSKRSKSTKPPNYTCQQCTKKGIVLCELCDRVDPPSKAVKLLGSELPNDSDTLFLRCERCVSTFHSSCLLQAIWPNDERAVKTLGKMKRGHKCHECLEYDVVIETVYTYRDVVTSPVKVDDISDEEDEVVKEDGKAGIVGDDDVTIVDQNSASATASSSKKATVDALQSKATLNTPQSTREYYCKFEGFPWRFATWLPEKWIKKVADRKLLAFHRQIAIQEAESAASKSNLPRHQIQKHPIPGDIPIPQEWLFIDRVVDVTFAKGYSVHQALALPTGQAANALPYVESMKVVWSGASGLRAYSDINTSVENYWTDLKTTDPKLNRNLRDAYRNWIRRQKIPGEALHYLAKQRLLPRQSFHPIEATPEYIGNPLKDYQIEGVNWLLYNWWHNRSSIIADEMGLGKTVQVLTCLSILENEFKKFPFLIVVPSSTLGHWQRELKEWAPRLDVTMYAGDEPTRKLIAQYEIFGGSLKAKNICCHVVLTSYESILRDANKFASIKWEVVVADEGHRIKNDESKGFSRLTDSIQSKHRILMTGTPLQNNLKELYTLMSFLDPIKFPVGERADTIWEKEYLDLTPDVVTQLHDDLKPYFLRRTKDVVLKDLPPKIEMFVPVGMSREQKVLYKAVLTNSYGSLRGMESKLKAGSLQNILMQLRKVVAHPYLLNAPPDENDLRDTNPAEAHRRHVMASGKLVLLQKVLRVLRKEGHRVLIFSQFRMALDEIETFLIGEGYLYGRMDGTTVVSSRQRLIDDFNDPQSDQFAFLLTTRAGGVGVNLTGADTVILYDADWNPHCDLQAMARSHRIGQTKPVFVYKLFTAGCVEERIVQVCKRKMVLDEVIVESMEKEKLSKDAISGIIRFGAEALFSENENVNENTAIYDDAAVDKLLHREFFLEELRNRKEDPEKELNQNNAFSFAKVWTLDPIVDEDLAAAAPNGEIIDTNPDPAFWDRVLQGQRDETGRNSSEVVDLEYKNDSTDPNEMDYVPDDDMDDGSGGASKRSRRLKRRVAVKPISYTESNELDSSPAAGRKRKAGFGRTAADDEDFAGVASPQSDAAAEFDHHDEDDEDDFEHSLKKNKKKSKLVKQELARQQQNEQQQYDRGQYIIFSDEITAPEALPRVNMYVDNASQAGLRGVAVPPVERKATIKKPKATPLQNMPLPVVAASGRATLPLPSRWNDAAGRQYQADFMNNARQTDLGRASTMAPPPTRAYPSPVLQQMQAQPGPSAATKKGKAPQNNKVEQLKRNGKPNGHSSPPTVAPELATMLQSLSREELADYHAQMTNGTLTAAELKKLMKVRVAELQAFSSSSSLPPSPAAPSIPPNHASPNIVPGRLNTNIASIPSGSNSHINSLQTSPLVAPMPVGWAYPPVAAPVRSLQNIPGVNGPVDPNYRRTASPGVSSNAASSGTVAPPPTAVNPPVTMTDRNQTHAPPPTAVKPPTTMIVNHPTAPHFAVVNNGSQPSMTILNQPARRPSQPPPKISQQPSSIRTPQPPASSLRRIEPATAVYNHGLRNTGSTGVNTTITPTQPDGVMITSPESRFSFLSSLASSSNPVMPQPGVNGRMGGIVVIPGPRIAGPGPDVGGGGSADSPFRGSSRMQAPVNGGSGSSSNGPIIQPQQRAAQQDAAHSQTSPLQTSQQPPKSLVGKAAKAALVIDLVSSDEDE
ncbi:hypothetical protein SmJEL517_g02628 [Synchytrium microbalum]|uniref:Uncharacterized protein n=1 Tax=Synchytrium microbalum TaxID=1806994 RepID=A0A507C1E5_9FUNG|nr:uncharacterized protein SmJEL517_g02628 [Synchytrium microbalum]TPX34927.1 hypothetical protein SmJEL517_g02628 [Synchytrium microbalum]